MNKNLPQSGGIKALNRCTKTKICSIDVNECISRNLNIGSITQNCKSCFLKFLKCISKECSGACLEEDRSPNECEKCAKDSKCSLNECNSPNYLPYKNELKGMSFE